MKSDDLLGLITTLGISISVGGFFALQMARTRRCRNTIQRGLGYDRIAEVLRGDVATDPSFDGPFIRFQEQGQRAYFYQAMLSNAVPKVLTSLECRIGFAGFLEATSTVCMRYPSRSPRFARLRDIAGFQIVTTNPEWAVEILDGGLREILRDINFWFRRPVRIQLAGDRFLVEVEAMLDARRIPWLAGLLSRVAALGGRRTLDSTGIRIVEELAVSPQGRCPVCCQDFVPPGVHCPQCRTPHHSDCWAYWGRCAIFGCRSRVAG